MNLALHQFLIGSEQPIHCVPVPSYAFAVAEELELLGETLNLDKAEFLKFVVRADLGRLLMFVRGLVPWLGDMLGMDYAYYRLFFAFGVCSVYLTNMHTVMFGDGFGVPYVDINGPHYRRACTELGGVLQVDYELEFFYHARMVMLALPVPIPAYPAILEDELPELFID